MVHINKHPQPEVAMTHVYHYWCIEKAASNPKQDTLHDDKMPCLLRETILADAYKRKHDRHTAVAKLAISSEREQAKRPTQVIGRSHRGRR